MGDEEYDWHKWQPVLAVSFVPGMCLAEEEGSGRDILVDYKDPSSKAQRVMISGTYLRSSDSKLDNVFYLVQLCVTRCKDLRIDGMVYDIKHDKIEMRHGVSLLKDMWCDLEKKLSKDLQDKVWSRRCEYLKE